MWANISHMLKCTRLDSTYRLWCTQAGTENRMTVIQKENSCLAAKRNAIVSKTSAMKRAYYYTWTLFFPCSSKLPGSYEQYLFTNCTRTSGKTVTLLKRAEKLWTSVLLRVAEAIPRTRWNCGERIRHFTVAYSPVTEHQRQQSCEMNMHEQSNTARRSSESDLPRKHNLRASVSARSLKPLSLSRLFLPWVLTEAGIERCTAKNYKSFNYCLLETERVFLTVIILPHCSILFLYPRPCCWPLSKTGCLPEEP